MHRDDETTIAPARRAGFTLVEMLVVLALIGLLLGFTSLAVLRFRDSGRETEARARISSLSMQLESYADRMGAYPPSRLAGLGVTDGSDLNEGIEALVVAFKHPDYPGQRPDEGWMANRDGDATQMLRLVDGSRALVEVVDPWDNPFVYIQNGDYGKEFSYELEGELGLEVVTVRARRNPLTDAWHRFDSFQLISAGSDGMLGTEDDIANFETLAEDD